LQLAVLVRAMSFFQGAPQTSTVALLPDVVSASAVSSVFGLYQSVPALSVRPGRPWAVHWPPRSASRRSSGS
jgi:hypothetical protein